MKTTSRLPPFHAANGNDYKHVRHTTKTLITTTGVRANFFQGAEPSLPKNFSTVPEKTAMLTCKITLPDTPYPVIISKKNPGFWALYLMNSVFFV